MTDAEDGEAHPFICTYDGDISLVDNPTTFVKALEAYKEILTRSHIESVPMRAYLTPLHKFYDGVDKPFLEASRITGKVEAVFQAYLSLRILVNDLAASKVCKYFLGIRAQLDSCGSLVDRLWRDYRDTIGSYLANLPMCLMNDLESKSAEVRLYLDVLKELHIWLEEKKEEMRILDNYLKSFEKITFAFSPFDSSHFLYGVEIEFTVCFVFRAAPETDAFLTRISRRMQKVTDGSATENETSQKSWYKDQETLMSLDADAKNFLGFFEANKSRRRLKFMVKDDHLEGKSHDIILYEGGQPRQFVIPGKPGVPEALEITPDTVLLSWDPPIRGSESVEGYLVSWRPDNRQDPWRKVKVTDKIEIVIIFDLKPDSKILCKVSLADSAYFEMDTFHRILKSFVHKQVQSLCSIGSSEESGVSEPIQTSLPYSG